MEKTIEELKKVLSSIFNQTSDKVDYFLENAIDFTLKYTNRKKYTKELKSIVLDLALFYIKNDTLDGVKSRSEGAISESYIDTTQIPKSILDRLNAYRLVSLVK